MPERSKALEAAQRALEDHIQEYFHARRADYDYGEWFDPMYFDLSEFVGRKGKRIRPLLLMVCYQAFGGQWSLSDKSVLNAALAVELLHSFILMHDDVIDRSDLRRGLPTFHKLAQRRLEPLESSARHGENLAVVIGDMVFAMAVDALADTEFSAELRLKVQRKFLRFSADTGAGELLDVLMGCRDISRVPPEQIEQMYYLKTTRYTFEAPCILGATLAGASKEKLSGLERFVLPIGLAFQIDNDLREFRRLDADSSGWSSDILEGKKTLLVRTAFERLGEMDRGFLQMCLGTDRKTESTLVKVQDLIRKSGAVETLTQRNAELFAEGEAVLDSGVFSTSEAAALRDAVGSIRSQVCLAV